jgi:hypothetical protein
MQIFLSFASEQRELAEPILLALRDRGHKVFFSHDDLPAGASFDARIQKAVQGSDLMVFLVSPEAVTKGRYTMTELAFARDRWPNPNGRILPVMLVDTPQSSIPHYLKAVTILEPEGNVAAETSVAAEQLAQRSNRRTILSFALCGLATGAISYLAIRFSGQFLRFSFVSGIGPGGATVIPGIVFGVLVAGCLYRFGIRDRFLIALAVLVTVAAWIAAYDSTAVTHAYLDHFQREKVGAAPGSPPSDAAGGGNLDPFAGNQRERLPIRGALSFAVGGFVGGLGTTLAVAIASPRFRRFEFWVATVFVAILFAVLPELYSRLTGELTLLALFATWQAAVMASIARALAQDS